MNQSRVMQHNNASGNIDALKLERQFAWLPWRAGQASYPPFLIQAAGSSR